MNKKGLFLGLIFLFYVVFSHATEDGCDKKVFLSILARNKAHLLPYYLKTIENLDYDKKNIIIYINTNDNFDETEDLLLDWVKKHKKSYKSLFFEKNEYALDFKGPHDWSLKRIEILAKIRNKSLQLAREMKADYYFVVDCDNFIIPSTLKDLIKNDKPIIAPMLVSFPEKNDICSNFYSAVDENGYLKFEETYFRILFRHLIGVFKVPLVHCTYLIKGEFLDRLSYDLENNHEWEFIVFAKRAREKGIDQYICNEKYFGTNMNFNEKLTLDQEKERIKDLPLSTFCLSSKD